MDELQPFMTVDGFIAGVWVPSLVVGTLLPAFWSYRRRYQGGFESNGIKRRGQLERRVNMEPVVTGLTTGIANAATSMMKAVGDIPACGSACDGSYCRHWRGYQGVP